MFENVFIYILKLYLFWKKYQIKILMLSDNSKY